VDRRINELRRVKDHFARFVPEAVKRLIAANPEAPELAKQEQDVSAGPFSFRIGVANQA